MRVCMFVCVNKSGLDFDENFSNLFKRSIRILLYVGLCIFCICLLNKPCAGAKNAK